MNALKKNTPYAIAFLGLFASILFAVNYPAVESIGTKVRLPVFHGATTWANLMGFAVMAVLAFLYILRGSEKIYRLTEALRWTNIGLWIVGAALGFLAALSTWDFTGSLTGPFEVLISDPRLISQLLIALAGIVVLILPTILESKKSLAIADLAYAIATLGGLLWATNAGKALHPDSPVMNSDEFIIKALFFCMVIGMSLFTAAMTVGIANSRTRRLAAKQINALES